jgi:hypothetical protein
MKPPPFRPKTISKAMRPERASLFGEYRESFRRHAVIYIRTAMQELPLNSFIQMETPELLK